MYILIIKYRERGSFPNEHDETKVFSAKCEVYRYISAIDLRYYIKVEENGHTFIDNSK